MILGYAPFLWKKIRSPSDGWERLFAYYKNHMGSDPALEVGSHSPTSSKAYDQLQEEINSSFTDTESFD